MKIFRMENGAGEGPFIYYGLHSDRKRNKYFRRLTEEVPWLHLDFWGRGLEPDDTHPFHTQDVRETPPEAILAPGDDFVHSPWRVGLQSEELFFHWFPKSSLKFFAEFGFYIVEYECDCDEVHLGTYQCLFCWEKSTLLRKVKADESL